MVTVGALAVRNLARSWFRGLTHPGAVMRALPDMGKPKIGLQAAAARFALQDLLVTLPLALLRRKPFSPSRLPVRPEQHYRTQLVLLPLFGTGQWLLMGVAAQGLLRLAGERTELNRVLDVIGLGMLIPMPPLWLCDISLIVSNRFRLPELAFLNPTVQMWETALFVLGLHTALGVPWRRAVPAGFAASAVYVVGASNFVR